MKTIFITDTLKITVDSYNNHQPHVYDPGGNVITVGKYKDQLSKPRWVAHERYYPKLGMVLDYCLEQGLVEGVPTLEGDMTLTEALEIMKQIDAKREEFCKTTFKVV